MIILPEHVGVLNLQYTFPTTIIPLLPLNMQKRIKDSVKDI